MDSNLSLIVYGLAKNGVTVVHASA
jgi:hypothetical protein